jgi:hypothetical protein
MSDAISAHGTMIARSGQLITPVAYVDIAEVGDITPISFTRNEHDVTTQNDDIDAYVLGVLRRGPVSFVINFLGNDATHDEIAGLLYSIANHHKDKWRITFPDGTVWSFTAGISGFTPEAPVDGPLRATVTLRPTGLMTLNALEVGATE